MFIKVECKYVWIICVSSSSTYELNAQILYFDMQSSYSVQVYVEHCWHNQWFHTASTDTFITLRLV